MKPLRLAPSLLVSMTLVLGLAKDALATYPGINGAIAHADPIDVGAIDSRRGVFLSPGRRISELVTRSVVAGNTTSTCNDNDRYPAWSPDGRRLAFVRQDWRDSRQEHSIRIVDSNDGCRLVAGMGQSGGPTPELDPDGSGTLDAGEMDILESMFRKPPGPARGYDAFRHPDRPGDAEWARSGN